MECSTQIVRDLGELHNYHFERPLEYWQRQQQSHLEHLARPLITLYCLAWTTCKDPLAQQRLPQWCPPQLLKKPFGSPLPGFPEVYVQAASHAMQEGNDTTSTQDLLRSVLHTSLASSALFNYQPRATQSKCALELVYFLNQRNRLEITDYTTW